jgi:hypothetical protein
MVVLSGLVPGFGSCSWARIGKARTTEKKAAQRFMEAPERSLKAGAIFVTVECTGSVRKG